MSEPLQVEIWSDVACPWCYIGKRRFEEGLRSLGDDVQVDLTYRSFELSPDTPVDFEGSVVDFLAAHKGMPREQVAGMIAQVTEIAASVGLDYDMGAVQHTKTLAAHEVLHLAKAQGRQLEMAERLFRAYFVEGRHVGRPDELADLAAEVGLDRADVVAALEASTYADDVAADIAQARAYGISGVPFAVIEGRYGVSGAQPPEVFARALAQALAERDGVPAGASA